MRFIVIALVLLLFSSAANAQDDAAQEFAAEIAIDTEYNLQLVEGTPMVLDFPLQDRKVKALLDTGTTGRIVSHNSLFKQLSLKGKFTTEQIDEYGNSFDAAGGMLYSALFGSERKSWFPIISRQADYDESDDAEDCIVPMEFIDSDFAIFLLSQKRLLLGHAEPSDADHAGNNTFPNLDDIAKVIPYFDAQNGIMVAVSADGTDGLAFIDTGSYVTQTAQNFIDIHPALFTDTGETEYTIALAEAKAEGKVPRIEDVPADLPHFYHCSCFTLRGADVKDDIKIEGDILAEDATDDDGNPVAKSEPGLPDRLSYMRADYPSIAPILSIGMDVLGKYDFIIDRWGKQLYLWDPAQAEAILKGKAS
jgi:hypothetical protein